MTFLGSHWENTKTGLPGRPIVGPLPIVRTLTDCEQTETGWQGVREDGTILRVTYDPKGPLAGKIAEMPENNRVAAIENGQPVEYQLKRRPVEIAPKGARSPEQPAGLCGRLKPQLSGLSIQHGDQESSDILVDQKRPLALHVPVERDLSQRLRDLLASELAAQLDRLRHSLHALRRSSVMEDNDHDGTT